MGLLCCKEFQNLLSLIFVIDNECDFLFVSICAQYLWLTEHVSIDASCLQHVLVVPDRFAEGPLCVKSRVAVKCHLNKLSIG